MLTRIYIFLIASGVVGIANGVTVWDISEDTVITEGRYDLVSVDKEYPSANSQIQIYGGNLENLQLFGASQTDIYDEASVGVVWASDSSIVSVHGGTINTVSSGVSSIVNLYYLTPYNGRDVYTGISDNGTLNIYGYGFEWTFGDTSADFSGYWLNGEPITFHFRNYHNDALERISIIPEPASFLLFGLAGIFFLRNKKP